MDEFTEFDSRTLEALRQPLEDRKVSIVRTKGARMLPSDFLLIAALNPASTLSGDDAVIRQKTQRQAQKLSRPIIDRIDLWVEVSRVPHQTLVGKDEAESSASMRERAAAARSYMESFSPGFSCTKDAAQAFRTAAERLSLSPRGFMRTLRVAKTIAALAGQEQIELPHILEALQYRPTDAFSI